MEATIGAATIIPKVTTDMTEAITATPTQNTSWGPTAKVAVGTLAGAVTTIMLQTLKSCGVALSAEVGGAITTILTFAIQYLTPERG